MQYHTVHVTMHSHLLMHFCGHYSIEFMLIRSIMDGGKFVLNS